MEQCEGISSTDPGTNYFLREVLEDSATVQIGESGKTVTIKKGTAPAPAAEPSNENF